ncbi:hypothetical protein [Nostoc sp. CHAB 5715]|uniref:hypothetical protein n=1 Tax=Nostoc sp. CHAB 5715 TaxID=2780400 RepID=UPI001E50E360|nr:hypothetical protein [Nostoc sp. CHAB 5715]MCC5622286.1 hypothetical protein [Nostoc sp. CHAB 5715]
MIGFSSLIRCSYSAFQVIELHHSLLPTPHSPSHLWSKYLKNAVRIFIGWVEGRETQQTLQ